MEREGGREVLLRGEREGRRDGERRDGIVT